MDLTVVVFNNNIYGMTGGQYSPHHAAGRQGHHGALRRH
jgi:pyruvate/2-oxoacid:ferredoxin oxidoreductase beta subunit